MRVVKPQPVLANFSPTQWGDQAQMCIAIGVGFRLSDPRVLVHEASVWEALRANPTVAPLSETGMPKRCAEWLLAGQTQCEFASADLGLVRDWTAQVSLGKSVKKISAQSIVMQDERGLVLGRLSVDHTQSIRGANAVNPAGCKRATSPLQILTWHGPQSIALAGMTPIDASWPERRQWMPKFASTLEGMALDGSHMGWPKDTDKRYFQHAAPDQWSADVVWPTGASYELRGFGVIGRGYAGNLPKLAPKVVLVSDDVEETVELMQQTVWFLPDHDLGVMWWSGAVDIAHPLDDRLSMMVVALHEIGHRPLAGDMVAYAVRRTNLKAPDLAAQSDVPLLPALNAGWAWEQILNADQHPRDQRSALSYENLRTQIFEEEERMAEVYTQMHKLVHASSLTKTSASPSSPDAQYPSAWKIKVDKAEGKKLQDETFTRQNFQGCDWTGWTLVNVRFESCNMNHSKWTDCIFENVEFIDTSFEDVYWRDIAWTRGAMEQCKIDRAMWRSISLTHVRLVQCIFSEHEVIIGRWSHVMMDEVECLSASWCKLMTESLAVIKSKLAGLRVRECTHDKLSVIETDSRRSEWVQSRFINAAFVEHSSLSESHWQDCDCISTCWIGVQANNVRIEYCSFTNLNAQSAHLIGSEWSFCNLNDAQFLNTDLREASFDSTSLRGALMSGAMLQESQITHSNLICANASNAIHPVSGLWRKNLEGGAVMHPRRYA
jgi:uncharacterized protein YjbI with pentapeptide repeats